MDSKRVNNPDKYVLAGIILLLLAAPAAFAIVGNVSVISAGEPVAGATISLQTPDGQVVDEEESDDDGKAAFFIPDSHRGKKLIVVTSKDGRTARQTVAVGEGGDLKIVVDLPRSTPAPKKPADGFGLDVMITGLYKWAGFDGSQDYVTGGLSEKGDLDAGSAGVGVDLRIHPPAGSLGDLPLFFVVGAGFPFDMQERGVEADNHPVAGVVDSFVEVEEDWFLRMLVGWQPWTIRNVKVALFGGVQITQIDGQFTTDESGGGGIVNRFSDSETMVAPVVGLGFTCPLGNSPVQLVGNWYLTWLDDICGGGRSTLGLDYEYEVEGGVQSEFQVGVLIPIR